MRTLIYKRTHPGDPDDEGRFGIQDCMGKVRSRGFEAVIGVGGIGSLSRSYGLDEKINWIGIGPHVRSDPGKRGPVVTFDHFLLWEADGPCFREYAPKLAERMYSRNTRHVMDKLDAQEQAEVEHILTLAKEAAPSSADVPSRVLNTERCRPRNPAKPVKDCSCRPTHRPAGRTRP